MSAVDVTRSHTDGRGDRASVVFEIHYYQKQVDGFYGGVCLFVAGGESGWGG
jgi:hypothetical protein